MLSAAVLMYKGGISYVQNVFRAFKVEINLLLVGFQAARRLSTLSALSG